jgi:uncharacterized protein YraI
MQRRRNLVLALFCLTASSMVGAEPAFTLKPVNLRAGPARDYPLVAQLPPGAGVEVAGCLGGYSWCDVIAGPLRGWVYARNLGSPYQGQNVPILGYGPTLGLPVITFSLGTYWDRYYRGRPWYGNRSQYLHRPPPRPGPPLGAPPAPRPPRPVPPRPSETRPPPARPPLRPPPPNSGRPGPAPRERADPRP